MDRERDSFKTSKPQTSTHITVQTNKQAARQTNKQKVIESANKASGLTKAYNLKRI